MKEEEWAGSKIEYSLDRIVVLRYDIFTLVYVNFNTRWKFRVKSKKEPFFYINKDLYPLSIVPCRTISDIYTYFKRGNEYYSIPFV